MQVRNCVACLCLRLLQPTGHHLQEEDPYRVAVRFFSHWLLC
eukprot:COSAG06_NODE_4444_length_4257_cov_2.427609_3_plen_42_part_00